MIKSPRKDEAGLHSGLLIKGPIAASPHFVVQYYALCMRPRQNPYSIRPDSDSCVISLALH